MAARWQVACREEEVPEPGDFVEYTIGDQSILVVRSGTGRDPGPPQRLPAPRDPPRDRLRHVRRRADPLPVPRVAVRPRRGAWSTSSIARSSAACPTASRLGEVRCDTWGGFVCINLDGAARRCSSSSTRLPPMLAPYHLDQLRLRAYRSTILPANWKSVVDAFNEGYHVQGTHPQLLPWTDDVGLVYEQFGIHSHYGRLADAPRQLRPSPRLGLADGSWDEGEILANLVQRPRRAVLRRGGRARRPSSGPTPVPAGQTLLGRYQQRRRRCSSRRGAWTSRVSPTTS